MARRMIEPLTGATYESLRDGFVWDLPPRANMGVLCSDDQPPDHPALVLVPDVGERRVVTFGELSGMSDRLAAGLRSAGVEQGDRVAIVAPQSLETGLSHLALWKLGAISLPLASLFGPDALAYRLLDSGARSAIVSPDNVEKVRAAVPDLDLIVTGSGGRFDELLGSTTQFEAVDTSLDDPAFLIYTSGTTGPPKGALHAHRSVFGHLPSFELYYEFAPQPGDVIWTPADWAWIGGLMDVVIPGWYHGMTVLASDRRFDPLEAADLMAEQRVTAAFLPPTALKMMRRAGVHRTDLALRAVFTGGEALGEEMLLWANEALGTTINEGYGQTECNLVVGNCRSVWPVRPGSMGRPIPGHEVAVLSDRGDPLIGEEGEICIRAPDPVMMLRYWNLPDATVNKYRDGWLRTGDLGVMDEDGYLWFRSRADDVIISSGYRIGPGEIEESLMGHPAVAMAAVVGVADDMRGAVPAAFVVLNDGYGSDDALIRELQQHVRTRLAAHEVPRSVTFLEELPRTTTGKIMRRELRNR
ncbi:MAG: AMP-binding protein [Acidimicrobiia bacterium]|nr:AMP-binding protein [Acidimicrobiia bacterium]